MSETTVNKPELTEKQRYWLEHIQNAETQNISLASYAQSNQLDLKALYNWKWILGKKGFIDSDKSASDQAEFTQVKMVNNTMTPLAAYLPNGVRLEVREGLTLPLLREFIHCIGQLA